MPPEPMSKAELLQAFADAYEDLIASASRADQRDASRSRGTGWGRREVVAHLAGWEIMATVRIPAIVAGMPPAEFSDPAQDQVMNDAINAAFVALAGSQSVEALCDTLRRAYQQTLEILRQLDEPFFRPGDYVYERTRGVIEHCQEHTDAHLSDGA